MANPFSRIGLPNRPQLSAHNRERTDSEDLNQDDQARKNVPPPEKKLNVILSMKQKAFSRQGSDFAGLIREICSGLTDKISDVLESAFSF